MALNAMHFVFVALLLTPSWQQNAPDDKTLEVRVDRVIAACIEHGRCGDELAVGLESARASTQFMRGWKLRDAKVSLPDAPQAVLDDVQRRMSTTTAIDFLTVDIEVESVSGNQAVVNARQRFSRLIQVAPSTNRRRISSVRHREVWKKDGGVWTLQEFTEHDQEARWADEK